MFVIAVPRKSLIRAIVLVQLAAQDHQLADTQALGGHVDVVPFDDAADAEGPAAYEQYVAAFLYSYKPYLTPRQLCDHLRGVPAG